MDRPTEAAPLPDLAVEKLELMFAHERTRARTRIVSAMAAAMGKTPGRAPMPDTIVFGGLLPGGESKPYYLWFHIDSFEPGTSGGEHQHIPVERSSVRRVPRSAASHYFVHLLFEGIPEQPAPKEYRSRAKAGYTVEWALSMLEKMGEPDRALAKAKLELRRDTPTKHAGLPLAFREELLEATGAEYRAVPGSKGPLRRFRWSHEKGTLKVEMMYDAGTILPLGEVWERQLDAAESLLRELL